MKGTPKDSEKLLWDQMRSPSSNNITVSSSSSRALPKLLVWLIVFISFTYIVYTLKLVSTPCNCSEDSSDPFHHPSTSSRVSNIRVSAAEENQNTTVQYVGQVEKSKVSPKTGLQHIVFGIAASARLWEQRKNYIKLWWKPDEMRGIVWLDKQVQTRRDEGLPPLRISGNTSRFAYKNRQGHRSAIRISRIVSETLRLGMENVRWFVMGDDDTVFIPDNLVRVLSKYDHNQFYYIGSLSESHLQNIYFSYGMAYGGGGFAISYPLAKALEKMQDSCIQRYPGLYGSDDRVQACMAELGVPLTKELGFHQYDVYGNLFGLLAAHPVAPLVSVHHLDVVEPIFPNVTRVQALQRLMVPMKLDSAGLMQQSICYDKDRTWTVSVSWGFAVQIIRGVFSPREMEMPSRTFLNWYRRADYTAYAFNTRPVSRNPCQKPFVFYFSKSWLDSDSQRTVTEYVQHRVPHPACRWKMLDPAGVDKIVVYKRPDPHLWDKSPRRNCCRLLPSESDGTVLIDVGGSPRGKNSAFVPLVFAISLMIAIVGVAYRRRTEVRDYLVWSPLPVDAPESNSNSTYSCSNDASFSIACGNKGLWCHFAVKRILKVDHLAIARVFNTPKKRDDKGRPHAGLEAKAKEATDEEKKRKLENYLENENGGAGVYSVNLRKHYILANEEWKEDITPEILDGYNVSLRGVRKGEFIGREYDGSDAIDVDVDWSNKKLRMKSQSRSWSNCSVLSLVYVGPLLDPSAPVADNRLMLVPNAVITVEGDLQRMRILKQTPHAMDQSLDVDPKTGPTNAVSL
ncbi:hypothetical protein NE237_026997 [Protea cynaroides]|uniref:NOG C-terminal domain-containing protein n=1 Tax=Protea cynaroides TaxID=273540 RepID=A0A9Q0JTT0_9MAGN|nr:hypothetical protein NE237_026997 [Protea cynaroides]